jgi:maltooligosyltrehalose synthase
MAASVTVRVIGPTCVSHLYASPYLRARPGSLHGYDIVDHSQLNPELGDYASFRSVRTASHMSTCAALLVSRAPAMSAAMPRRAPFQADWIQFGFVDGVDKEPACASEGRQAWKR